MSSQNYTKNLFILLIFSGAYGAFAKDSLKLINVQN